MDEKKPERMDDKRAAEVLVTLRSAHRGPDHVWAFRSDLATAADELELARASEAALVAEVRRLRGELDAAWSAAATPVRGMVTLAEVIEGRRDAYEEIKAREATLLDAINAVREAVAK